MAKYSFVIHGTISLNLDVEADDLDDAIVKAKCTEVMGLCWQCASSKPQQWSTSGELDCDPANSPLVSLRIDGEDQPDDYVARWSGT